MKLKDLFNKFKELETIEEKSFWITAPVISAVGFLGLLTTGFYGSSIPTIVSAVLCLIFPISLIIFVSIKKNYHIAYALLCILIGAISVPITFISSGGFLSGMPLFCAAITGITALCYSQKYRAISFALCLVGNTASFVFVYLLGSPFPLQGTEELYNNADAIRAIYNDMLFGYYCVSFGLFLMLNWVTKDIQKYKLSRDALQKFFDGQKRTEIIKNALNNKPGKKAEHGNAAIVFADISNFTTTTEHMNSEMISDFLNEFFSSAGNFIHENDGIIDKYIGDCAMAYWIDDGKNNPVLSAVKAMLDLKKEMYGKAQYIHDKYGVELNFSVGIGYGDVIFGDIGTDSLHDYTVIGDAVNTASRIQDIAVSGQILVSGDAADKIKDFVNLKLEKDNYFPQGKHKSVDVYSVLSIKDSQSESEFYEKEYYGYELHVCGCRGSFPVSGIRFAEYGGETSCYVIKKDDYALIVDCGTGLKNAMEIVQGCKTIDVLLTHVHYDHILGFLMSKFPLDAKIRMFGRFDLWNKGTNTLEDFMQHPYWPVEIIKSQENNITIGKDIKLNNDIVATFYESDHPDNACVIKLMIKDKKIVFLADCENANKLDRSISENAEIVFFDGMFDDNDVISHKGWGHGTWQDGVRFAKDKNVKKLVVTHHNPELGDQSLKIKDIEAHNMENRVSFAKSGDIHNI